MVGATSAYLVLVLRVIPVSHYHDSMKLRGAEQKQSGTITPKFVLNVLRQWWKIAMPLGLILSAAGCVVVFLMYKPEYEAKSLLWIDDEQPHILQKTHADRDFVKDQQG